MAGTWTNQNKVIPGIYIRFGSSQQGSITAGDRGTVAICEPMSWGAPGQVVTVNAGEDVTPYCGYDITSPNARFLREIFKGTNRTSGASTVLLYRPTAAGSVAASGSAGNLTFTARYVGARGNDITIVVVEDVPEGEGSPTFTVDTVVDGTIVDQQSNITTVADLSDNAWVTFTGEGNVSATTGVALTNGADGEVASAAYSAFLSTIEAYKFDVLIYDGTDSTVGSAFLSFIKRMNEENGVCCQLCAANLTAPDTRYCINVVSGATLEDGTALTPAQVTWWAGGAAAGAQYFESLTNAAYPGAVSTSNMTTSALISALNAGQFVLNASNGRVSIVQDINSLVTYTTDISEVYRYNKTVRLCSSIANDLYAEFQQNYIGVINNNAEGRSTFHKAIYGYLLQIQANEGIQNLDAQDITVEPGEAINAIVVTIAIQPVGAVEKVYITILMDV